MAECVFCKANTGLHEDGVPICLRCSVVRTKRKPIKSPEIQRILEDRIVEVTARFRMAKAAYNAAMSEISNGVPRPDGSARINTASRELDAARKEMIEAHEFLNDYIVRGIVLEDLKRSV